MASFSKQVSAWVNDEAKANATLIFRTAASAMYEETIRTKAHGGRLPHDTGNLGRSFAVQPDTVPAVDTVEIEYTDNTAAYTVTIDNADIGDTLGMGFQAVYAPRQEYGFVGTDSLGRNYNQAGNYFVQNAVDMWPQLVAQAEAQFGE